LAIFKLETEFVLKKLVLFLSIWVVCGLLWPAPVLALQQGGADNPVYIVQEGDSLWDIAQRFHLSMDELAQANGITDPNQISAGSQLIIPGLAGVSGVLATQSIPYGENLRSLSRRYQTPEPALVKLNHLTSPAELYAGYSLVLPQKDEANPLGKRAMLTPGQSLLELAVANGTNTWETAQSNGLAGPVQALPGDTLLFPGADSDGPGALPWEVSSIEINPEAMLQGKVTVIKVDTPQEMELTGSLMDHELHFFRDGEKGYVALQGVYALAEPGLYPLSIQGTLQDGASFTYSQPVPVLAVDYPYDKPLTVDPTTVDPAVTKPEDEQWAALTAPATPERFWDGIFKIPSSLPVDYCLETGECWSSRFGNRRSYNGSPYNRFHAGLDIVGDVGAEIYAPAAGKVVFTGPLTVRGNATVIDHGWGVYTAYMHQSEILVHVGDMVEAGQLIGKVGATGRVQGPHLHWEVWAGGAQVDPLDWLEHAYP
jgi:murein DD-endopeptidase MepM/ murein hydrolase activator NlpD